MKKWLKKIWARLFGKRYISIDVSDGVDHACVVKHVKDADGHIYILDMKHFKMNESQKMIMKHMREHPHDRVVLSKTRQHSYYYMKKMIQLKKMIEGGMIKFPK